MAVKVKRPGFRKGARPTGLAAVANSYAETTITMGRGGKVGQIFPPSATSLKGYDHWRVGLMVKKESTKESPCGWKWVIFKKEFETEEEARSLVKKDWEKLLEKFDLYEMEE